MLKWSYWKGSIYRIWHTVAAYIALLKLRSTTLNSISGIIGVFLASGSAVPWGTTWPVFTSVWLAGAGCAALNSYLERDIDGLMARTSRRPLPSGRIKPAEKAIYVGILLIAAGLAVSTVWLSLLATLFIALGAIIYVPVYTMWLKRRTPWSLIIGGLAGNCAMLAGWFAVTSGLNLILALTNVFIFVWTLGHFWGLAIRFKDDSQQAGTPTLASIYGERVTAKWAALCNIALIPLSIIPYFLGSLGMIYLYTVLIAGLMMLTVNLKLLLAPTPQRAWTVFKISSPYLAVFYFAMFIDTFFI